MRYHRHLLSERQDSVVERLCLLLLELPLKRIRVNHLTQPSLGVAKMGGNILEFHQGVGDQEVYKLHMLVRQGCDFSHYLRRA